MDRIRNTALNFPEFPYKVDLFIDGRALLLAHSSTLLFVYSGALLFVDR